MAWKIAIIAATLVAILTISCIWFSPGSPDPLSQDATTATPTLEGHLPESDQDAAPSIDEAASNSLTKNDLLDPEKWTPERMAEVTELRNWQERHGYFNSSSRFGQLSNEELMAFVESDDIGALHDMADRQSVKDPGVAIEYLERAAALGSTSALVRAGQLYSTHASLGKDPFGGTQDESHTRSTALAYLLTAQMAGDDFSAGTATKNVLRETEYNDEMKSQACDQAIAIYERLQRERSHTGLGDYERTSAPGGGGVPIGASFQEICTGY